MGRSLQRVVTRLETETQTGRETCFLPHNLATFSNLSQFFILNFKLSHSNITYAYDFISFKHKYLIIKKV